MPAFLPRCPIGSIAAAALAALACTAAVAGGGRLPQLSPAKPGTLTGTCESLAARLTDLPSTVITGSTTIAAGALTVGGKPVGAHCRVAGRSNERVSPVDGKTYAIKFEMRLPVAWNGRFFHQGNGGIDGSVVTALGATLGGPLTHALAQGFAVISSDAGHDNAVHGGSAFGFDPQARLDYGYQAAMAMTPVGKGIIAAAYGRGPDRSYFGGCSNGGRHTMIAAVRQAQEYDGFLAGAPGYRLPLAALANIFGAQRYAMVATASPNTPAGLGTAFTPEERRTVADAVLARCDALDGAVDGIVQATRACQAVFDLQRDVPTCAGTRDGSCLSTAQKIAIAPIFSGATTSDGTPFYAPFPYDTGIASGGIPFWEFTAPLVLDSGSLGVIFKVPPEPSALSNGPGFALNLDIDKALAELSATNATYTESALSFATPPNASDLSTLQRRGGKILVYHGVSDPIFSWEDSVRWYRDLARDTGGDPRNYARLYGVPGMGHCSGGAATDQADLLSPLVKWVERGVEPGAITASARGVGNAGPVNAEVPANWAPNRTRPLCPYPGVARYIGRGDPEQASSWACRGGGHHH